MSSAPAQFVTMHSLREWNDNSSYTPNCQTITEGFEMPKVSITYKNTIIILVIATILYILLARK